MDVFCILVGDGENKDSLIEFSKKENVEENIVYWKYRQHGCKKIL